MVGQPFLLFWCTIQSGKRKVCGCGKDDVCYPRIGKIDKDFELKTINA